MENYSVSLTNEFLQLYKKLEEVQSKNPSLFDKYKSYNYKKIESFRNFRNLLSHNESALNYPAIVSESFVKELKDTISKLCTTAYDVCTKKSDLCVASVNDCLSKAIIVMNKHNYSRIPILSQNGSVKYIITEKTIVSILADKFAGKEIKINDSDVIGDFLSYFEINKNPSEKFIFVGRNEPAFDVEKRMGHIADKRRTSIAFVTETGDPDQAILGLITASNLLNY